MFREGSLIFIVTEPPGYFHRFCGISRPKAGKSDTCCRAAFVEFSQKSFLFAFFRYNSKV